MWKDHPGQISRPGQVVKEQPASGIVGISDKLHGDRLKETLMRIIPHGCLNRDV